MLKNFKYILRKQRSNSLQDNKSPERILSRRRSISDPSDMSISKSKFIENIEKKKKVAIELEKIVKPFDCKNKDSNVNGWKSYKLSSENKKILEIDDDYLCVKRVNYQKNLDARDSRYPIGSIYDNKENEFIAKNVLRYTYKFSNKACEDLNQTKRDAIQP